ncbi:MAG: hypothetical protein WKG07_06775 [Hymenobacter sp.]
MRKLLEMTSHDVHLLADGEKVYALGRHVGHYEASREDLFDIQLRDALRLGVRARRARAAALALRPAHAAPPAPQPRPLQARPEAAPSASTMRAEKALLLWEVVLEASRQPHGTLLVITTEALAEADRLKLQCTLIEPVPLTPLITQPRHQHRRRRAARPRRLLLLHRRDSGRQGQRPRHQHPRRPLQLGRALRRKLALPLPGRGGERRRAWWTCSPRKTWPKPGSKHSLMNSP